MTKNGVKQVKRPASGVPLPETSPDLEALKKMVRLLERKHRAFLEQDWKEKRDHDPAIWTVIDDE